METMWPLSAPSVVCFSCPDTITGLCTNLDSCRMFVPAFDRDMSTKSRALRLQCALHCFWNASRARSEGEHQHRGVIVISRVRPNVRLRNKTNACASPHLTLADQIVSTRVAAQQQTLFLFSLTSLALPVCSTLFTPCTPISQ